MRRTARLSPRTRAAVLAGKLARRASRRTGRGGTALPGLVAERIDSELVEQLAGQLDTAVLITGTNGKTTTARMLAGILEAAGCPVVHNRAGSNLMRGIGAALIEAAGPAGTLPSGAAGVFETDEATLREAAAAVRPAAVLIGNLSRDQLDRYGEIEAVRGQWLATIAALPRETTVVLNADDPSVSTLARAARGPVLQFGVDDPEVAQPSDAEQHSLDALWDAESGVDYVYERRYLAHLGHWRCPALNGGGTEFGRPAPDLAAEVVDLGTTDGIRFDLMWSDRHETVPVRSPLSGLYNVYNALAALTTARALGVDAQIAIDAVAETAAAFGRQEKLEVAGHPTRILLGKNPAGVNAALQTLLSDGPHHLLVLLNDDLADGTDVSWIWDTDWELLREHTASLVVGGRRAGDMALRLRYAGLPEPIAVKQEITEALSDRLNILPAGAPLLVLPTYTALLSVRDRLGELAGARRIWEGA